MRREERENGLIGWAVACRRASLGFTLLELLTVIAIVAVLSGIAIGAGRHAIEAGKNARAKAELAALSVALDAYCRSYGDYPRTNDSISLLQALIGRRSPTGALVTGPVTIDSGKFAISVGGDPFANPTAQLLDPWEQPYRYTYKTQSPWTNSSYVLWSVGPDGADAGVMLAGGYADRAATQNLDNIYANQ